MERRRFANTPAVAPTNPRYVMAYFNCYGTEQGSGEGTRWQIRSNTSYLEFVPEASVAA